MADPTKGKIIAVTVTNGTAGEKVKITNLSRAAAPVFVAINSDKQAVYNTANSGATWQSGDTVVISVAGRIQDSTQVVLSGGGANVTLSGSADTSTPGVEL